MGWSSANEYFDVVVEALDAHNVDEKTQYHVLLPLAEALRGGDWDTLEESLEAFPNNVAVRKVMALYDIYPVCTCKCCDHEER